MGYVLGICGIVLAGALVFALVYAFFNKKYDLDDVGINSKEDRKYGSSELDYDYDDDDRVELFDDMIDFARKAEEEDFDRVVDEIDKFVARRLPELEQDNSNVSNLVNAGDSEIPPVVSNQPVIVSEPVLTPVFNQVPINTPQVQPTVQVPVNDVVNQQVVVQQPVNIVSEVSPTIQQPVQNSIPQLSPQPVLQKLSGEQQSLFEQIDVEGPDDYVEEL